MNRKYIIYTATGDFEVEANNLKTAIRLGRFNCRQTKTVYVSAKWKR